MRSRNVERFQRGLVFKANRLLYHSIVGSRALKKKVVAAGGEVEVCKPHEDEHDALEFSSQTVFKKPSCKCQFPHKFVNVFSILVIMKDKLTDLCGNSPLTTL